MNSRLVLRRGVCSSLVLVAVIFMSGCFSLSVHPLYDEASLVFEPGLLGLWGDPEDPQSGSWEFLPAGEKVYRLIIREGDHLKVDPVLDGLFEARLVSLDGELYLDLFPEEPEMGNDIYKSHIVPAHSFWRVKLEGHVLTLSLFGSTFVENALADGTLTIDHIKRDGVLVFTAPTGEVQDLVTRFRDQVFEDDETLKRLQR